VVRPNLHAQHSLSDVPTIGAQQNQRTSFCPVFPEVFTTWHRSGGPRSRKEATIARFGRDERLRFQSDDHVPRISVRAVSDSPSSTFGDQFLHLRVSYRKHFQLFCYLTSKNSGTSLNASIRGSMCSVHLFGDFQFTRIPIVPPVPFANRRSNLSLLLLSLLCTRSIALRQASF
jgi:hypothetical protein